jgi:putative ABC transport system substrate-binding protein
MIRRRQCLTLLGGAALGWPLAARAQQPVSPVIGVLSAADLGINTSRLAAFRKGLSETGFVEGQNITIEYRFADLQYDRMPTLAADLVRRQVAAIYSAGIPATRAAKAATTAIPIVFSFGEDPVAEGIVPNFNRPGGNITGFTYFANQLIGKRLGLLSEIMPKAAVFAYLLHANNPVSNPDERAARNAAGALGRQLEVFAVSGESDMESAFTAMSLRRIGALAVDVVPFFLDRRDQVISLAARHRIPAIYDQRAFPGAGGLMSYGANEEETRRSAGIYIGRILKGEKPGELPVQQSTKLDFVINLKTARALGLDIPPTAVALADEVIE